MQRHDDTHEHDRGLRYDLRSLSRRRALMLLATGAVATTAAACGTDTSGSGTTAAEAASSTDAAGTSGTAQQCVEAAPGETAGPYPGDGSNGPNVLIASGIVRSDIRSSFGDASGTADGVPTTLTITLQDLVDDCSPGQGMAVYVWHCDREGNYSLYSDAAADENYLRGVQVADADGVVRFTTIFPACYAGRWPHIHFEVFDSLEQAVAGSDARLTSQIALPEDACTEVFDHDSGYAQSISNMSNVTLSSDNVFGDGWDAELATVTGTPADGMDISITIGVASAEDNQQSMGAPPAGGPGGPGGPPPGGPGGPPAQG
ncbi:dioxygenase [Gordonia sp. HNM0687]|uniref:Dioxygenase n=1 Tax=Gordonia mangrovi TaxID=2665643 RepID=A0A6L7GY20_9ACTN|nr:intradiol ring-cleavage dioxygenase [Gordonia mangrovi]MXP23565.1 dioxygenase [Gordonia mangrovi]UVF79633.1 intradiol ring-cleavage dioxygenase [Gordonia mangrovi]